MTHSEVADKKRLSLLFVCTGNACRSQIAEGWARYLLPKSRLAKEFEFCVGSAGLEAHGLNPNAVLVMQEAGVDISAQTSDLLDVQQVENADWVITLCDHADRYCPDIPGTVQKRHWGLLDPAKADVSESDELAPFRRTREEVKTTLLEWIAEQEQQLGETQGTSYVSQFDADDVEVNAETIYQGFLELQQLQIKHRLFEGGWSDVFQRELLVRHPAVIVLLYDPLRDAVVLIEQFRVGALADQQGPWLLEMVAGIVDPGESLAEVARREALEEAGCQVLELEQVMQFWTSPGGSNEQVTLFCAKVDATDVGGVHGLVEEHENIRVHVVCFEEALNALAQGVIRDAASTIALQWLQLHKDELYARWSV